MSKKTKQSVPGTRAAVVDPLEVTETVEPESASEPMAEELAEGPVETTQAPAVEEVLSPRAENIIRPVEVMVEPPVTSTPEFLAFASNGSGSFALRAVTAREKQDASLRPDGSVVTLSEWEPAEDNLWSRLEVTTEYDENKRPIYTEVRRRFEHRAGN